MELVAFFALTFGVVLFTSLLTVTIAQLPVEIAYQLEALLLNQTLNRTDKCSEIDKSDISLLLYNRDHLYSPLILNLNNPVQLETNKKIIMIIHGWITTPSLVGLPEMKNAYLKRYDCNLITVDWSKLSWQLYSYSACELPKIADILAGFLCVVNKKLHVPLETVHLVGHSLGAQMSGLIGQGTKLKCKQTIGWITAMDPAGPLYQGLPALERLDRSDASFVHVLHTNQGVLGYFGDCGDVDFYANCGTFQPGCVYPIAVGICDHLRSLAYITESINSRNFKARRCNKCWGECEPDSSKSTEIIMGEDCPKNARGRYVFYTNGESPFATE